MQAPLDGGKKLHVGKTDRDKTVLRKAVVGQETALSLRECKRCQEVRARPDSDQGRACDGKPGEWQCPGAECMLPTALLGTAARIRDDNWSAMSWMQVFRWADMPQQLPSAALMS